MKREAKQPRASICAPSRLFNPDRVWELTPRPNPGNFPKRILQFVHKRIKLGRIKQLIKNNSTRL